MKKKFIVDGVMLWWGEVLQNVNCADADICGYQSL